MQQAREGDVLEEVCFPSMTKERCGFICVGILTGIAVSFANPIALAFAKTLTIKSLVVLGNGTLGGFLGNITYSAVKGVAVCHNAFFDNPESRARDLEEGQPSVYVPPQATGS